MADEVRLIDANALRLMKVAECAGHTIEFAAGWKACVEYCKNDAPAIEVEPDNDWISVKDRLPPTGVPILIYVYNIEEMTVVSLDHDGLGFSNDDEWFNIKNIHHWRHLPKPPKGE